MGDVIHFGKHKGKDYADVPEDYLRWMLREFKQGTSRWRQANQEIARRNGVDIRPSDWKPPVVPDMPRDERDRLFAEIVDVSMGTVRYVEDAPYLPDSSVLGRNAEL